MSNPYSNFGTDEERYNAILNKRYQYYHNTHPDGGEIPWEERTDKNPDVNFLADIYYQKDKNGVPFGTPQSPGVGVRFITDFKSSGGLRWTEQQSFSIFQQEFEHHLNMALSRYGADKFSGSDNKQKKLVYDGWALTLRDPKALYKRVKYGGIDTIFPNHRVLYLYANKDVKLDDALAAGRTVENDIELIIDVLDFAKWANENAPDEESKLSGVDDLENATAKQLATIKNALAEEAGIDTDAPPTPEEKRSLRQCALLSDLMYKGYSYTDYPKNWNRGSDPWNKAYNGRIYPVTNAATFDPNSLSNLCFMPNNVQSFFKVNVDDEDISNDILFWKLFWVYRDSRGLQETEILRKPSPNNPDGVLKPPIAGVWADDSGALTKGLKAVIKQDILSNDYTIESVNIVYDGTNPATARNDVKVEIKIHLNHIKSLDTVCAYGPVVSEQPAGLGGDVLGTTRGGTALIKIRDLVTIPQDKSVTVVTPGGGNYFSNTYTPETSRIRLKVWSIADLQQFTDTDANALDPEETTGTSTAIILDLTLIDHTITRNSDVNNTTQLTISYRGYFEEAMNAPYNDALTDHTVITNRINRVDTLRETSENKCSDNLIREMKRVMDEEQRIEMKSFQDKGGLVKVLFDKNLLYSYKINRTLYDQGRIGTTLDPTVGNYIQTGSISRVSAAKTLDRYTKPSRKSDVLIGSTENPDGRHKSFQEAVPTMTDTCFYLGDLMEVILDCLYKPDTPDHWSHCRDMNMRFIVGTISIPDPNNLSNTININPLQIPIDLAFFNSWYHDTIVKKGIESYAVGPFIRDLIERMINDVLYETCFALLQLDETPPQLRSTFVTDSSGDWHSSGPNGWYTPNLNGRTILMSKDIYAPLSNTRNYCLIYQQYPSFFRQKRINPDGPGSLKNNSSIPTLFDGFNNRAANFCDEVTFAKAESAKYLKESRYFNNAFGNLALFANVYNLNFKISTKRLNTFLYPGTIINFIVTDFIEGDFTGGTIPDEGSPHIHGSLPNVLGLGGYFVITKVSYNLSVVESVGSSVISIESRFIGTDARIPIVGEDSSSNPFADEPANCIEDYTATVLSLRQSEIDTGIEAQDFSLLHTNNTGSSYAQPLPEISSPAASSNSGGNPPERAAEITPPTTKQISDVSTKILQDLSFEQITKVTKKSVTIGLVKYKATPFSIEKGSRSITWKLTAKNQETQYKTIQYNKN